MRASGPRRTHDFACEDPPCVSRARTCLWGACPFSPPWWPIPAQNPCPPFRRRLNPFLCRQVGSTGNQKHRSRNDQASRTRADKTTSPQRANVPTNGCFALTKRLHNWPALMRSTTARHYLDGIAAEKFAAVVVPHLEARSVGGELRYTRRSIDDWIDHGYRAGEAQTPDALGRLIDGDDMAEGGKAVR